MTIQEAIQQRHSVRRYADKPIEREKVAALRALIERCNAESGLNIQLVTDEPTAFDCRMARYGRFSGVSNYFALIGRADVPNLDEIIGYYGEKLVLEAQMLGLNTCWVALTYKKKPEFLQATVRRRAFRTRLSRWKKCRKSMVRCPTGFVAALRRLCWHQRPSISRNSRFRLRMEIKSGRKPDGAISRRLTSAS